MQHISHYSTRTIKLFFILQMKQGFGSPCLDFPSKAPAGLKQQIDGKMVQWLDGLFQATSRSQEMGWEAPCCLGWAGFRCLEKCEYKASFVGKSEEEDLLQQPKGWGWTSAVGHKPMSQGHSEMPRGGPKGPGCSSLQAQEGSVAGEPVDQALQGRRCMHGC